MPIDTSAMKAPPRKTATSPRTSSAKASATPRLTAREMREDGLNGVGQAAQALCLMSGQFADAATIGTHGPGLAREIAVLADTNEWIAKGTDFLIKVGPLSGLLAVIIPFASQLAVNHGLMPAPTMPGSGIVPKEVLEAQAKAQIMRMQAEAMRQQQQAMQDAQEAQAELENFMARVNGESVTVSVS